MNFFKTASGKRINLDLVKHFTPGTQPGKIKMGSNPAHGYAGEPEQIPYEIGNEVTVELTMSDGMKEKYTGADAEGLLEKLNA